MLKKNFFRKIIHYKIYFLIIGLLLEYGSRRTANENSNHKPRELTKKQQKENVISIFAKTERELNPFKLGKNFIMKIYSEEITFSAGNVKNCFADGVLF